jgi:hypothetical protein
MSYTDTSDGRKIIGDGVTTTAVVGSGGGGGSPVKVGAEAKAAEVTPAVAADSVNALVTDVYRQLVTAAFEWASRSDRIKEQNPLSTHYNPPSTTSTGAVTNATPYDLIIDMDGYRGCEVAIENTVAGAGDTFAVTYHASVEGVDPGDQWLDATTNGWNLVAGATLAVDHIMASEPFHVPRGHMVRITTLGGNNDMEFDIHVKTWY